MPQPARPAGAAAREPDVAARAPGSAFELHRPSVGSPAGGHLAAEGGAVGGDAEARCLALKLQNFGSL